MSETLSVTYWCHACEHIVTPITEPDIKCPSCNSGFVERVDGVDDTSSAAERVRALLQRMRIRLELLDVIQQHLELIPPEPSNREARAQRDRQEITMIQAFTRALPFVSSDSIGDYFVGSNFDALLEDLAELDPNRHGTPPARIEAVSALPVVKIEVEETAGCPVCLENFEIGEEAVEMPCGHRFHGACCLFPWLEMHSSCPVCRFQLPTDDQSNDRNGGDVDGSSDEDLGIGIFD